MDMASCVFARRRLFDPKMSWFLRLRADASPQGGRDFLVVEADHCRMGIKSPFCSNKTARELIDEGRFSIAKRLLPLSVIGARAASSVHKAQNLLRVLGMEASDLKVAVRRTYSFLSDFGAEAGVWNMPSILESSESESQESFVPARLLPLALPISDVDHGLHHATRPSTMPKVQRGRVTSNDDILVELETC